MKITSLNGTWELEMNGQKSEVTVPHDFMIGTERKADNSTGADHGYFTPGRAVYHKTFTADPDSARHYLRFDGVMGLTEVYLNNQQLRFHPYGYTAFVCDCGKYLKPGENRITVMADTTAQVTSRWYTGGGIIREAELMTGDRDVIAPWGLYVRTVSLNGSDVYAAFETTVLSDMDQEGKLTFTVADETGEIVRFVRHIWLNEGETVYKCTRMLHGITPWDTENPKLYTVSVTLTTDHSEDTADIRTGFRTVQCDDERGFLLNGVPVKMNGMCNHHDNGILGAVSIRGAEERRVRILKQDGFNAIRTSHNPPSSVMLDLCDEYGILVIDEIFDAWRVGKRDMDYHIWFDRYHEEDTRSMVIRDRNHPSVVMWSTGNEISEKKGTSGGYKIASRLAEIIRSLDDRPLTHALCDFWDDWEYRQKEEADRWKPATEMDFFSDRTAITSETLDVVGYNYMGWRLEKDEIRFPDRLFAITESFPMDAAWIKKTMDTHPRLIGEFVWTGWDYFGETGLGRVEYDKEGRMWGLSGFPGHHANCGDYSICSFRKAQWYYRHAAYHKGEVNIMTVDPDLYGRKYAISAWGLYNCERTWTYPGREDKTTTVYLCTVADEAELWQDGVSLGRFQPDEKGIITVDVPYRPGELTAVGYVNGEEAGRDSIRTAGDAAFLNLRTESYRDGTVFCEITAVDADGNTVPVYEDSITVEAENGEVIATGSGRMDDDHIYTEPSCRAYQGKLLAVIRRTGGPLKIRAYSHNLESIVTENE